MCASDFSQKLNIDTINYNGIPTASDPASQKRRNEALLEAATKGYTQRLRALLKSGVDVDYANEFGETALYLAIHGDFSEGVKMLIDAGSDINRADMMGIEPLMVAAASQSSEVLEILLDTPGIDIDAVVDHGHTAMHAAIEFGCADNVALLAQCDCHVNTPDMKGNTPLHAAAEIGGEAGLRMVEALVCAGARSSIKNKEDRTPVQIVELRMSELSSEDVDDLVLYRGMIESLNKAAP